MRKYIALIVAVCSVFLVFYNSENISQPVEIAENQSIASSDAVVDAHGKQSHIKHDVENSVTTNTTPNVDSKLTGNAADSIMPAKQVFNSEKFKSFISSSDYLSQKSSFISDIKNNKSYESELEINKEFNEKMKSKPEFSKLSLDVAECDVDACIVSLSGLEYLSKDDIEKLENEMTSNKSGMAKVTAKGTGGTYGFFNDNGMTYFRIVYIINDKFSGMN
jgi:hypothetical protein